MLNKDKNEKTKFHLDFKLELSLLFASVAMLVFGAVSVFTDGGITYYSMRGLVNKVLPAILIFGLLGYVIAVITYKPEKVKPSKTLEEALIEDVLGANALEPEDNLEMSGSISDNLDLNNQIMPAVDESAPPPFIPPDNMT